jgi:hypothetical protein
MRFEVQSLNWHPSLDVLGVSQLLTTPCLLLFLLQGWPPNAAQGQDWHQQFFFLTLLNSSGQPDWRAKLLGQYRYEQMN